MLKGTLNMSMALDIGKVLLKLQGLLVVALKIFSIMTNKSIEYIELFFSKSEFLTLKSVYGYEGCIHPLVAVMNFQFDHEPRFCKEPNKSIYSPLFDPIFYWRFLFNMNSTKAKCFIVLLHPKMIFLVIIHLPVCRSNSIKAFFVFVTQFKIF